MTLPVFQHSTSLGSLMLGVDIMKNLNPGVIELILVTGRSAWPE